MLFPDTSGDGPVLDLETLFNNQAQQYRDHGQRMALVCERLLLSPLSYPLPRARADPTVC